MLAHGKGKPQSPPIPYTRLRSQVESPIMRYAAGREDHPARVLKRAYSFEIAGRFVRVTTRCQILAESVST